MKTRTGDQGGAIVSIILLQAACLLLQGCATPVPGRGAAGPGVRAEIIVLTAQQADELGLLRTGKRAQQSDGGAGIRPPGRTTGDGERAEAGTLTRPPVIRAYRIARYRDPSDPRVLHEAHTVYRIEEDGDWVLGPDATEQDGRRIQKSTTPKPRGAGATAEDKTGETGAEARDGPPTS